MRLYFIAMQFLTIIPLPFAPRCEGSDMGRSMRWFPLVGLTIGVLLAVLDRVLALVLPAPLVALLLVTALAVITGALHLDGVADVADGFGARGGRERFLAVMKDSSTGAIGAVGVALVLLLKSQALLQLTPEMGHSAIILFPAAARFAQVVLTAGALHARADGLGATFAAGAGYRETAVAAATTFTAGWLLLGPKGVLCCIVVTLFALVCRKYFHHRLGGITGDIIGATSEVAEIVFLLTAIAVAGA